METKNFENDLHHAMSNAGISDFGLLSDCLYIDADDTREYLTMKLVSAITNYKRKSNNEDANTPILTYKNSGRVVPLNDWENLKYFMASFSSLFSFGIGGHISRIRGSKKGNIPLKLRGKWALLHHLWR